jgi:hypothetical protein
MESRPFFIVHLLPLLGLKCATGGRKPSRQTQVFHSVIEIVTDDAKRQIVHQQKESAICKCMNFALPDKTVTGNSVGFAGSA